MLAMDIHFNTMPVPDESLEKEVEKITERSKELKELDDKMKEIHSREISPMIRLIMSQIPLFISVVLAWVFTVRFITFFLVTTLGFAVSLFVNTLISWYNANVHLSMAMTLLDEIANKIEGGVNKKKETVDDEGKLELPLKRDKND